MKSKLQLEYREKYWQSEFKEYTDEEMEQLEEFVRALVKGETTYAAIDCETTGEFQSKTYFPSEVLKEAIITIITLKS